MSTFRSPWPSMQYLLLKSSQIPRSLARSLLFAPLCSLRTSCILHSCHVMPYVSCFTPCTHYASHSFFEHPFFSSCRNSHTFGCMAFLHWFAPLDPSSWSRTACTCMPWHFVSLSVDFMCHVMHLLDQIFWGFRFHVKRLQYSQVSTHA